MKLCQFFSNWQTVFSYIVRLLEQTFGQKMASSNVDTHNNMHFCCLTHKQKKWTMWGLSVRKKVKTTYRVTVQLKITICLPQADNLWKKGFFSPSLDLNVIENAVSLKMKHVTSFRQCSSCHFMWIVCKKWSVPFDRVGTLRTSQAQSTTLSKKRKKPDGSWDCCLLLSLQAFRYKQLWRAHRQGRPSFKVRWCQCTHIWRQKEI